MWTVASLPYKQQNVSANSFLSKHFLYESDFCTITPQFSYPVSKTFSLQLFTAIDHEYGKTQTRVFSTLGPEAEEQIKLAINKIRSHLQLSKGDLDARI